MNVPDQGKYSEGMKEVKIVEHVLKCFATFAEIDFSQLCMYFIRHPALTRGLRVLQNENRSPKSLSASQSHVLCITNVFCPQRWPQIILINL